MSQKNERNSKRTFSCCPCFGRRTSSDNFPIGSTDPNEPCDYVVEKLAIRKVPISLIGTTAEDFQKQSKIMSEAATAPFFSQRSQRPVVLPVLPVEQPTFPITEKESVFSAYYQITQRPDIETVSHTTIPKHQSSLTSLQFQPAPPQQVYTLLPHTSRSKKTVEQDQEMEIVSQILNTHASLFTLDTKQAIPKDPDHLPSNRVVVPPSVRSALRNPVLEQFPPIYAPHGRQQIQIAEVHRNSETEVPMFLSSLIYPPTDPVVEVRRNTEPINVPPMKYPTTVPATKKELTPEMKETIRALGFAQPVHIPGMPPKNQRNVRVVSINEDGMEKEMGRSPVGLLGPLVVAQVTEKVPSLEMSHHQPGKEKKPMHRTSVSLGRNGSRSDKELLSEKEPLEEMSFHPLAVKETKPIQKLSIAVGRNRSRSDKSDCEDYSDASTSKTQGNIPQFGKTLHVQQLSTGQNNKSLSTTPDSVEPIQAFPPLESVGTSDPQLQESGQITEISQLKGQSLKWKIIIKHHSDKKEADKTDFSDSEPESQPYLLSNRS